MWLNVPQQMNISLKYKETDIWLILKYTKNTYFIYQQLFNK